MKLNKENTIAFFRMLGFSKADGWDEGQLKKRIKMIPEKVDEEDVDKKYVESYRLLVKAASAKTIEFVEEEDGAEDEDPVMSMTKKEIAALIKKEKLDVKVKDHKTVGSLRQAVREAIDAKPVEEAPKKAATKKAASPKKEKSESKAEEKKVEKDPLGCRLGTISASVNEVLLEADGWTTEKEIIEKAQVTRDQALGRLYYMTEKGEVIREKVIRYRLKKK